MSLQRWAALMGTGTTESNLFYLLLTVFQYMPTAAGGGGKGRPPSPEKKLNLLLSMPMQQMSPPTNFQTL